MLCILAKNLVNVTVVPRQELGERDCRLLKILAIQTQAFISSFLAIFFILAWSRGC